VGIALPLGYATVDVDPGDYGAVLTDTYRVFGNRASWDAFVVAHGGKPGVLPGVDWNKELVIAAFAGQGPTPTAPATPPTPVTDTARVRITGVGLLGDQIVVQVETEDLATGTTGLRAPMQPARPYHLVTIERKALPERTAPTVVFVDRLGNTLERQVLGVVLQPAPRPSRPQWNDRAMLWR